MKPNTLFKRTYNRGLSQLGSLALASDVGSEPSWSKALEVSRTTVRAMLAQFSQDGLIDNDGRRKTLIRHPTPTDFYPEGETEPVAAIVEKRFMQWILQGDCRPGQAINVLELSRQFGVSASAIREYLSRLRPFGLVERRPSGAWVLHGFTAEFAEELCEVRAMFEMRSALRFISLRPEAPAWTALARIKDAHLELLAEAETRFADFSALDERFHRCINDVSRNRFIVDFYEIISMIFHYHYQWNKYDERERNIVAIGEHLRYIEALQSRDPRAVAEACRAHLATARLTLMASLQGAERAPAAAPGRGAPP